MSELEELCVDSGAVGGTEKDLTDRQRQVLSFIRQSIQDRGYPPTLREIGAHTGIRSTNGVNALLRALESKGYLERAELGAARIASRGLTAEQNQRIRDVIKTTLLPRFNNVESHLALELGVDQSTLAKFLAGVQGTSRNVAESVGRLMAVQPAELLGGATAERYPSKLAVLALIEAQGFDQATVSALRADVFGGDGDPGSDHWKRRALEIDRMREELAAGRATLALEAVEIPKALPPAAPEPEPSPETKELSRSDSKRGGKR